VKIKPGAVITWDNTNVFNDSHEYDELSKWYTNPLKYENITISGNLSDGASGFTPVNGYLCVSYGNSITFTAPVGLSFIKIEINGRLMNLHDANWSVQPNGIVWKKTPANAVTITCTENGYTTDFSGVTSIVFTVVELE
jgi:hypothetical protein